MPQHSLINYAIYQLIAFVGPSSHAVYNQEWLCLSTGLSDVLSILIIAILRDLWSSGKPSTFLRIEPFIWGRELFKNLKFSSIYAQE